MPAYNFKECFADDVERLIKRQTIRQKRKRRTKSGDRLYLYAGMRTKRCRKLVDTYCRKINDVEIRTGGIIVGLNGPSSLIGSPNADRFAKADGFRDSGEMIEWFRATYGLPFRGVVIYW